MSSADLLCELLGIEIPLIQAPIGSATCPELAAAVSNAGALGTLALSWRSPEETNAVLGRTRDLSTRPFGVNVVLEWPPEERVRASLETGVGVVSTFWGDPGPLARLVHDFGAVQIHSVGSADEAARAIDAGVDVVVAQGVEAGGHVRGTTPLEDLLPRVLEIAGGIPVVAAGGIATGPDAARWVEFGASGVWVGTRFLCSREARVHPSYQRAILSAREGDTYYGEVFTGGWESAPHRVLRNTTVNAWLEAGGPQPGRRPGEGDVVAWSPKGEPIERYADVIPLPGSTGDVAALALYAGAGSSRVLSVQASRVIVDEFRDALSCRTG